HRRPLALQRLCGNTYTRSFASTRVHSRLTPFRLLRPFAASSVLVLLAYVRRADRNPSRTSTTPTQPGTNRNSPHRSSASHAQALALRSRRRRPPIPFNHWLH